jgi:NADPH2:quinone reductase
VVTPFALGMLAQKGSLYVQRPTLATYIRARRDLEDTSGELFAMLASGLHVEDPRRYPLADAARAHRDLEARVTTGSIVLMPA